MVAFDDEDDDEILS